MQRQEKQARSAPPAPTRPRIHARTRPTSHPRRRTHLATPLGAPLGRKEPGVGTHLAVSHRRRRAPLLPGALRAHRVEAARCARARVPPTRHTAAPPHRRRTTPLAHARTRCARAALAHPEHVPRDEWSPARRPRAQVSCVVLVNIEAAPKTLHADCVFEEIDVRQGTPHRRHGAARLMMPAPHARRCSPSIACLRTATASRPGACQWPTGTARIGLRAATTSCPSSRRACCTLSRAPMSRPAGTHLPRLHPWERRPVAPDCVPC